VLTREKIPLIFTGLSMLNVFFGDITLAFNGAFFWGGIFLIEQFRNYNKIHLKYIKWLGFLSALVVAQQAPDFWKFFGQVLVVALALRWQARVRQYKS